MGRQCNCSSYFNEKLSVVASCCPVEGACWPCSLWSSGLLRNVGSNLSWGGINNGVCVWYQPAAEAWYQPNHGGAGFSFNTTCEDNLKGLALSRNFFPWRDSLSASCQRGPAHLTPSNHLSYLLFGDNPPPPPHAITAHVDSSDFQVKWEWNGRFLNWCFQKALAGIIMVFYFRRMQKTSMHLVLID